MERKKLIRIAIITIIVIIILIIVENSIRGIGSLVEKNRINKELEEKKEIYQNSEEYKETVMLEGVVADFVELLKNNDIDALYNLIDTNYKDYKYQNKKELFEEYIKQYVNSNSNISLLTYEKISGRYVCRLLSENGENIKSFVVLIKPENGLYTLIFDNITSIEKVSKGVKNQNDLECNVLFNVTAKQVSLYTLEFVNLSGKEMNYTIENVTIRDTYGNEFKATFDNKKIELKSDEKERKDVVFNSSEIHKFPKTILDIEMNNGKGKIDNIKILLKSDI